MKLRILNYRVSANHALLSSVPSINDAVSISDFDAFVFDPSGLNGDPFSQPAFLRRQAEINDLIHRKGGVVVCIMRPDDTVPQGFRRYQIFAAGSPTISGLMHSWLRQGEGSQVRLATSARGPSTGYFQVLKGAIRFTAHLALSESQVTQQGGTVFAFDSVGHPIAVEFILGQGRICFLPPPENVPADRMGAAVVKVVTAHFDKPTEIDAPPWLEAVTVPGADVHDRQIADLERKACEVELQLAAVREGRDALRSYTRLLFSYGKAVLEPTVRNALRLFGFNVPEPEQYAGEWDVEASDADSGRTVIGEIEGSEGPIDVDKYRQLLDYVEAEALEGRERKGILVGNGFRRSSPDSPERQDQFSEHARRGAARNQFCLLPATELFKAVCAILESPDNEALKVAIRASLFATTGPWSFVREGETKVEPTSKAAEV